MDNIKTILLIEHDRQIRVNLTEYLELSNYNVLCAENVEDAVKQATKNKLDLIVCNIMIPALDGYGIILMLQRDVHTRDTPLVFLTTKEERTKVGRGLELIANDYLTKPINGTELLNVIERRLGKDDEPEEQQSGITKFNKLVHSVTGKDALENFIKNRVVRKYKNKQIVYYEADRATKLFYIQKGKVKAFKINEDGKELIVSLYKEGDFMGYTSLMDGLVYTDTAETIEDCEIAFIPKNEFDELIYSNHNVMFKFVQLLTTNIAGYKDQLLNIAYNSTRKKVAEVLIAFSKKYKHETDEQFSMNITRLNLANMAGVAKESLIRTLSIFKDENIIELKGSDIIIIDEDKLINMVN